MERVLATAGNWTLPMVSIIDRGGSNLILRIRHMVGGTDRTDEIELSRETLRLIPAAVLTAMGWPS